MWFIRAPFYVLLVLVSMCSVLLFWLSRHYLPSDWLERPLWGSLTMARGSSAQSPCWRVFMIVQVYCVISLFKCMICLSCPPALHDILPTPTARYSLFVLKAPLNTKQTNKQDSRMAVELQLNRSCNHRRHVRNHPRASWWVVTPNLVSESNGLCLHSEHKNLPSPSPVCGWGGWWLMILKNSSEFLCVVGCFTKLGCSMLNGVDLIRENVEMHTILYCTTQICIAPSHHANQKRCHKHSTALV